MTEKEREAYVRWLRRFIERETPAGRTYDRLFDILMNREFIGIVPHDENLEEHGLELRGMYFGVRWADLGPCSVLEMLVALSQRITDIMVDDEPNFTDGYFFWRMLDNLGLIQFDDEAFEDWRTEDLVEDILNVLLERLYEYNGRGGLFPLKRPREDQRRVEIWYQAQAWLMETFDCL
ncbi:MAG: hypothetical protein ACLR4A_02775 [Christensenellales bacterium]